MDIQNSCISLSREIAEKLFVPRRKQEVNGCDVYMHVPCSAFLYDGEPKSFSAADAWNTADIVICRDGKVCLAIVKSDKLDWFRENMGSLYLVRFPEPKGNSFPGLPRCPEILGALKMAWFDAENGHYSLNAVELCRTSCIYLPISGLRLLERGGVPEELAKTHGIFGHVDIETASAIPAASTKTIYRLLEASLWKDSPSSDKRRVSMESLGIPPEKASREHIVTLFKQLQNMDLSVYFRDYPEDLKAFDRLLQRACVLCLGKAPHPFEGKEEIRTFRQAAEVVHFLSGLITSGNENISSRDNLAYMNLCADIMTALCMPVFRDLQKGDTYSDDSPFAVFHLPLAQYCYAACQANKSAYADYLYCSLCKSYLQSHAETPQNAVHFLAYAHQLDPQPEFRTCAYEILYSFLILPVLGR